MNALWQLSDVYESLDMTLTGLPGDAWTGKGINAIVVHVSGSSQAL